MTTRDTLSRPPESVFSIDWAPFFSPGTEVMALPNWDNPRLYLPAKNISDRWHHSDFYPAFRPRARAFKAGLRMWTTTRLASTRTVPHHDCSLFAFVRDCLPSVASVSVRPGWPGPEQKITVQLCSADGDILGYLKYAELTPARIRLQREHEMLGRLPDHLGPRVLKYDEWLDGEALVVSPVEGAPLPTSLPPPDGLAHFVRRLVNADYYEIDEHPWIRQREFPAGLLPALNTLRSRAWPVAIQHGDLTPWNMRRDSRGRLHAFDWEHGSIEGFPYLDLAHYILQIADLVKGWPPARTAAFATSFLVQQRELALSSDEAATLVRLAAFDAYRIGLEDGHDATEDFQAVRATIWKNNLSSL